MGDKSASVPKPTTLHPVYMVTDIQKKVRVLDGTKVSYSSWVKLFHLHARGYKVLHHIDGTRAPSKNDPEYDSWMEIDAIVLQWIYGTLSDDLLVRVLEPDTTAFEAWTKINNIFLNNKGARAATLEHEFNNLKLVAMPSLEAYCQRLKELSDQLNDVECPVNEKRLVLQLVRGLSIEFDTTGSFINQSLPTWETACSMLQLEQQRQSARDLNSTPEAMAVVTPVRHQKPRRDPNHNRGARQSGRKPNNHRGQNQSSFNVGSSSSNRGNRPHNNPTTGPSSRHPTHQQWAMAQFNHMPPQYWPPQFWTPPPCPYPN
ncbi:uncharacterized protein LOC143556353 [Bidens hawaiensis]|uniref:uncharacterized protein LOC143556353 n=1 Tax=Bidens hawaiensis TaxID=980011 RepID=UPI00404A6843